MSKVLLNSHRELYVDTVLALFASTVMPLLFPFYVVLTGNLVLAATFFVETMILTHLIDYVNLRKAIPREHLFSVTWSFVPFAYYYKRDKTGFPNFKLFHLNGCVFALSLFVLAFIV
ncbi:hypothetical protein TOTORO_01780 [Serratia phage vB_SmaS-Totoro]|nr:hypothetical protein TOTORO_01780 [Serratia phage vB_SmaS-Totoro]